MSNYNCLSEMVADFDNKGINIIVMTLQEILTVPYQDTVSIPGLNLITKTRTSGRGKWCLFLFKFLTYV
jgi:hypothetical protein